MFTLTHPKRCVGKGEGAHRHGWAEVTAELSKMQGGSLLLDDFLDYTFDPDKSKVKYHRDYRQPWIGILHHPPTIPNWYKRGGQDVKSLIENDRFRAAMPYLKMVVVLSQHLKNLLQGRLGDVPVVYIKHPMGEAPTTWKKKLFKAANPKYVVQVGWYMKNTQAIYQLKPAPRFQKLHLFQEERWIRRAHKRCREHYRRRHRWDEVERTTRLPNDAYDRLMCQSVAFMELIDASANNTVLDCLGRNTPLLVNRHPAVEDYLGVDYPYFYEHIAKAHERLTVERAIEAHEYLRDLDKSDLSYDHFKSQLSDAISCLC